MSLGLLAGSIQAASVFIPIMDP